MAENKEFQWTDSAALQFIGFYMAKRDNPDFNDTELVSDFKTRIMENASQSKQVEGGRDWQIVDWDSSNLKGREWKSYGVRPEEMLKTGFTIKSVKRLSDGVVFSIGDAAYDLCLKGTIKRIYIDEKGQCIVECSNVIPTGNDFIRIISQIHLDKAPEVKEPLFITEDGVKKYKGDHVFDVDTKAKEWTVGTWYDLPDPLRLNGSNSLPKDISGYKYFDKREAAEEYILMNKPCLSVNDVFSIISETGIPGADNKMYYWKQIEEGKLKTLAASKIKQP